MASVTLRGVGKDYDTLSIIPNLDLEIPDGCFLVLVGPSGCGKSTVLRMVAGLEETTRGRILIGKDDVTHEKPRERDVAMVFQSYALYPHMTVRANLGFGLKIRKMPAPELNKRVDEVADMLGLEELLDRLPRQLSGGQRQRVAMGRAIVRRPRVFLFDEPLSNLDAALRSKLRVELKKLHHQLKSTMIYVTHDQIEAMTLADQIVVLNKGKIQQKGTPEELYSRPNNRFVAGFIGSPPMNFFASEVHDGNSLRGEGHLLALSAHFESGPVLAGIRPNHLTLAEDGQPCVLKATVDVVEPIGWEAHLHCHVGEVLLCAQVEAAHAVGFRPGASIRFGAAPENIHLFQTQSGERLKPI